MEFKRILILKIASALSAILLMTAAMHGTVLAQEAEQDSRVVHLSMEEAVTRALRHNLGLQATQQDVAISRSQFRSTNALFLPTISVEESAVTTNNPLNTFGFLLKQEIVTTADFNPDFLNDPDPIDNFTTKIQIQQPLFNPDGYFKRGALKDQLKASREQLKRAEYYVEYLVRQQYYALMLSVREVGIVDTSLTAARANYEQASDFFRQGMIDRADLLLAEVRVKELESRRSAALQKKEEAQQQLAYLTGMEETVEFRLTDRMTLPRVDTVRVEYERLNSRRSDMKALGWMVKASEKQVNAAKFSFAPSINLFGSYEWNDDRLLGMDAGSYLAGATLRWNLFSGFENAGALQESSARLKKARLQYRDRALQNRVEVETARRSLNHARRQVALAESMVQQSSESYRIRFDRYRQGMEQISDLLEAEATLADARLQYAKALYRYNTVVLKMEFLLERPITEN